MKVLVTGARGFIGKNLVQRLLNDECADVGEVFEYDQDADPSLLETYCAECDFVFHLAGVNRPQDQTEFTSGNLDLTTGLLRLLSNRAVRCCSRQRHRLRLITDAGPARRQRKMECSHTPLRRAHLCSSTRFLRCSACGAARGYNTVVATFRHNIARDLRIAVKDPDGQIMLAYVDDVLGESIRALKGAIKSSANPRFLWPSPMQLRWPSSHRVFRN